MEKWKAKAQCVIEEHNPELFFHESSVVQARAVCRRCPVRNECLEHAIEMGEYKYGGMWGGLTAREIRKLRKRRIAARLTP